MSTNPDPPDEPTAAPTYVLPRYLRYARALALVSGAAALGIAAGVATVSTTGCASSCSGTPCNGQPYTPPTPSDAATDMRVPDGAGLDGANDGGGGPRPAPLLPRAWVG